MKMLPLIANRRDVHTMSSEHLPTDTRPWRSTRPRCHCPELCLGCVQTLTASSASSVPSRILGRETKSISKQNVPKYISKFVHILEYSIEFESIFKIKLFQKYFWMHRLQGVLIHTSITTVLTHEPQGFPGGVPVTILPLWITVVLFTSRRCIFRKRSDHKNQCELTEVHPSGEHYLHCRRQTTTTQGQACKPQDSRCRLTRCTRGSSLVIRVSPQQPYVAKWVTNVQQLRIFFWLLGHPKEPRTHSWGLELLLLLELNILHSCPGMEGPLLYVKSSAISEGLWILHCFPSVVLCLDRHPWTVQGRTFQTTSKSCRVNNALAS